MVESMAWIKHKRYAGEGEKERIVEIKEIDHTQISA